MDGVEGADDVDSVDGYEDPIPSGDAYDDPTANRFERQADLVPQDRIAESSVTVIGVGAIGRQVALQLAAIGTRRLSLIDFDTVELTNVTTQGYLADDVGYAKVRATAAAAGRIDPAIQIEMIEDRYRPK